MSTPRSWAWEAPQTLLGLALLGWLRLRGAVRSEGALSDRWLVETRGLGVSLGRVVVWCRADALGHSEAGGITLAHELGHAVQSRRLGPLYLPTVGVLSVSRVVRSLVSVARTGRPWAGYFDGWPEDEADRLGGVVRGQDGRRRWTARNVHADLEARAAFARITGRGRTDPPTAAPS